MTACDVNHNSFLCSSKLLMLLVEESSVREQHQIIITRVEEETQRDRATNEPFSKSDIIQGVQTSLGYAKCNVLKLRKVCKRSYVYKNDPIKRGILVILMM